MTRAPSHRRPAPFGRFPFGFCHYPEHGTDEQRAHDVDAIAASGANVVRLAEFAWDVMEPSPGKFDFALFDAQVAAFAERGIDTILCTPTAIPPPWMTAMHPDVGRVDERGLAMRHGSRQHACLAHPGFRERCRLIVAAMADHFRGTPGVIGWQVDNELNTHFTEDHHPAVLDGFRRWLADRYSSVDELNEVWGHRFWAQTVRSFDEVRLPVDMRPAAINTSAQLDYLRYLEWLTADFVHDQAALLRAADPEWFITTNVGLLNGADHRGRLADDLDVLAFDLYPVLFDFEPATRSRTQRRTLDAMRAWTGNLLVPEHQVGPSSWPAFESDRPEPGELRRMFWLTVASGADGVMFFRWRSFPAGPEMYWAGVVDHAGRTDWRLDELTRTKSELDAVAAHLAGTWVHVDAAVAGADQLNTDAHTTLTLGLPAPAVVADGVHDALVDRGWQAGFVHPTDDLSDVRLYVIPHWVVIDPAWIPPLEAWVRAGGTLVIGARSGTRDARNHVLDIPPPGPLTDLAGVTVTEAGRQNRPARTHVLDLDGTTHTSRHWYEQLHPAPDTRVVATWTNRHLTGTPAITARALGAGMVLYVGTYLDGPVLDAVLDHLHCGGLRPVLPPPPTGVIRTIRRHATADLVFHINATDDTVAIEPPPQATALLDDRDVDSSELPPNGIALHILPLA